MKKEHKKGVSNMEQFTLVDASTGPTAYKEYRFWVADKDSVDQIVLNPKLGTMPCKGVFTTHDNKHLSCDGLMSTKLILTVELADKWDAMHIIHPDGTSEEHTPCKYEVRYINNAFNPEDTQLYADTYNYYLDPVALILLTGGWELRVV